MSGTTPKKLSPPELVAKKLKGKERVAIIHCTASRFGNSFLVDHWHRLNGWGTYQHGMMVSAGYHYLVTNAHPWRKGIAYPELDGQVVGLRDVFTAGAHCRGANWHVGLAFVGGKPTDDQLAGLVNTCRILMARSVITGIKGHDEVRQLQGLQPKGCPGINMDKFRSLVMGVS